MDSSDPAVIFMETVILIYAVIAAACSSPQTTEVNADKRADTLMKWVNIGLAQCVLFVAIVVAIQHKNKRPLWPPLLGAAVGAPIMYGSYVYAKHAGMRSQLPGVED